LRKYFWNQKGLKIFMRQLAICLLGMLWIAPSLAALEPVILAAQAEQITGTRWVDISYEIQDPDSEAVSVYLKISADGGQTWEVPTVSAAGAVGRGIKTGVIQHIRWDSAVDLSNRYTKTLRFKLGTTDWEPPGGMNLIQEGSFEMAGPTHTVFLSEYAMDVHEITKEVWDSVRLWSLDHGYLDLPIGESFGGEHPLHTVNWFDCIKWCNARSEMQGLKPAYYVDSAFTIVYRSGRIAPHVDWQTGYRLPTEAEWEKAARGGATGHRFPWSDSEKITPDRANYDESEKSGSVKLGSYQPNGFGLYDMAGNHFEWCWDRYGDYTAEPQADPRGASVGVYRVFRGGSWYDNAKNCEIAHRRAFTLDTVYNRVGFRSVHPKPARPWMESETKDVTLDSHPRLIVNGREFDNTVKVGDRAAVQDRLAAGAEGVSARHPGEGACGARSRLRALSLGWCRSGTGRPRVVPHRDQCHTQDFSPVWPGAQAVPVVRGTMELNLSLLVRSVSRRRDATSLRLWHSERDRSTALRHGGQVA
jgi:formylglycine-generating enzyme required for sulfatase activity